MGEGEGDEDMEQELNEEESMYCTNIIILLSRSSNHSARK
jgi:hypothetical protein